MTRLFVYGTLKEKFSAHHLLYDQEGAKHFIGNAKTTKDYSIYNLGGYPGMVKENDGAGVFGEVYECSEATMKVLDRYECVDSGLFIRTEIELEDGTKAEAYISQAIYRAYRIENGRWEE